MILLFHNKFVPVAARIILGIVLIWASIYKIEDPIAFSKIVHNYHIFPIFLENIIALVVPWLELILGICLIFGVFLDGSATLTILLFIGFIIILSQAYIRNIDLHCGCFTTSTSANNIDMRVEMLRRIIEDIFYLGCALIIKYRKWYIFRFTKHTE